MIPSVVFADSSYHCCNPCQNIQAPDDLNAQTQCTAKCGGQYSYGSCSDLQPSIPSTIDTSDASGCKTVGKDTVCTLPNPIANNVTDVPTLIKNIITGLLGIIGALSLLMFVWGGASWLLSAGNPERVKAGTQTMIWAAIGVVFVFVSYIILQTVFTKLLSGG